MGPDQAAFRSALTAVLALSFVGAVKAAAPAAPSRAEVVKQISACRGIADAGERLACYDKAAAALDTAEASGDVVVVDRAEARAARRQAFGLNLPALGIFDRAATKGEMNTVNAMVASAYRVAEDRWIVVLDDGAVWRQIDDEVLSRNPHQGSNVRIRRASLGSYMMEIDGQPGIRVHRDQ
jgi:hypothetical protein